MPPPDVSYFDRYIYAGGLIMVILLPLSAYTLGFIIQRFIALRRVRIAPRSLVDIAQSVSTPGEYVAYRQTLSGVDCPLAKTALEYLELAEKAEPFDIEENPTPLDSAVDRLYHTVTPLGTVYTIAPLLGLLGTIIGMMNTFYNFAIVQQRDIATLAEGINYALVTTFWGLIIAIPAYVFASVLRNKVFRYEKDILPESLNAILNACAPFATRRWTVESVERPGEAMAGGAPPDSPGAQATGSAP